jgi:hypothetical protein
MLFARLFRNILKKNGLKSVKILNRADLNPPIDESILVSVLNYTVVTK